MSIEFSCCCARLDRSAHKEYGGLRHRGGNWMGHNEREDVEIVTARGKNWCFDQYTLAELGQSRPLF